MIHSAITKYLSDNNITQTALSVKAAIPQVPLNQALNGKRKMTIEEYMAICQALGVPLETFANKE
jgi:transcriptional regulator with XRE-family HTH domain